VLRKRVLIKRMKIQTTREAVQTTITMEVQAAVQMVTIRTKVVNAKRLKTTRVNLDALMAIIEVQTVIVNLLETRIRIPGK
jgi:hypothetical protein